MVPAYDTEELSVLEEFANNAKANSKEKLFIVRAGDIKKQMLYNFKYGKGRSLLLLEKALPFMQEMFGLIDEELKFLEKKALKVFN